MALKMDSWYRNYKFASENFFLVMPNCRENGQCWSKFDQPQGYKGKGTKGKGQGQDFYNLVKTLTLTKGKGFGGSGSGQVV